MRMLNPVLLREAFERSLGFADYVVTGTPQQQRTWSEKSEKVRLSPEQGNFLSGINRRVNILALSGLWCGDCAHQVPILGRIVEAAPNMLRLGLLDRDENLEMAEQVRICGGLRVPTVLWLNEDFEFLGLSGDKSLSRLRALARSNLGAACLLPEAGSNPDEWTATVSDWVQEVERVYLVARLSPKLRARHGD